MNKLYFIKAPCHQSLREQGFQFAPDEIKQKYDYVIDPGLFNNSIIDIAAHNIKLCPGYDLLYKYILKFATENQDHKIITIGGDHSISTGTIAAINEKYMKQYGDKCQSDLIVIWIDINPDLYDFNTSENKNLNEMSAASLLGLCDTSFTKNKLLLNPQQIIYYGLVDNDDNLEHVKNFEIPYFTINKINTLGTNIIINAIKKIIGHKPVHISLDMKAFDMTFAPSVIPPNKKGLSLEQIENLLISIKNNIVSMDIVEFNPCIGTPSDVKLTRETARYILKKVFDIKEKTINIFTDHSQFLVYRPLEQVDPETDIGWFILRGLNTKQKEELITNIPDDTIISIDIDGDSEIKDGTYLVTKTTLYEQNNKSYYTTNTINDVALYPQEKVLMGFELLNS